MFSTLGTGRTRAIILYIVLLMCSKGKVKFPVALEKNVLIFYGDIQNLMTSTENLTILLCTNKNTFSNNLHLYWVHKGYYKNIANAIKTQWYRTKSFAF